MAESFFTTVGANLVSKLGEYLFAPIGRQFGYVLCYKSYVKELQNGVQDLENARERVQHSVDEAVRDGKSIYNYVQDWLGSVAKEAEEARLLLESGKSPKSACLRGWIPNPLARHPIGRKVKETTEVIRGLHEKSRDSKFKKVYYENTPPGIVTAAASNTRSVDEKEDALESRALIMEDVMKALADDKVHVIGVWGAGGVGKTKLLADIEKRLKGEKLFDEVAMADVSRDPDPKNIQGEIAEALGLKLMNVETTRGRAECLRGRLDCHPKKNILILVDNLRKKLELKEVGIPCGDDNKVRGCKLLLTSRYRQVLRDDMCSDKLFKLEKLKHAEARRLFESTLGNDVHYPDFEPFVDGVVENCGGLPLFIVPLAKWLKNGDLPAWRYALTNIDGSVGKAILELTYKDLNDERIQSVFLVCALRAGSISLRDSLIYCMGLGLYEKFSKTLENARDRLLLDLHILEDSSLLLDSYDKKRFRMHDLFVDEAISIASAEWTPLVGKEGDEFKKWSDDELRKCTAISFPWLGIEDLPEKLDCPNLKMLLLLVRNLSPKIPSSFFESMEKLQVLDITGLSFTSLPSSIELHGNLKSLCLDQGHLEDVTVLGKLKGLQFLSFFRSTIPRLPKEIGGLTELRFLDLTGCTRLKVIEPGVLGSLVNLEELYMENSFDQWEAEDETPRSNASLAELKNMKKLRTLHITIPHSTNLSSDLPFGNLNEHKIRIGGTEGWFGEHKESRTLELKLDSGNLLQEVCMQECLGRAQYLRLEGLRDGRDTIHDLCAKGFRELKHLHVKNNSLFQSVVDSTHSLAFTRLESLVLKNLNKLEKICRDCLAPDSFGKLKIVKVKDCSEIKHLFHSSVTRNFLQLEEIKITRCHSMQQIIADAESDEYIDEIDDDANANSFKLRRLTLQNLPNMTSFCKIGDHSAIFLDGQQVLFPCLEELTLTSCGLTKIWHSELSEESFCKLESITVQDCENLSHIFPSTLIERFRSLKMIEVVKCTSLEALMEHVAVNSKKRQKHLVFLELEEVKLWDLPRLNALVPSSTKATLSLPSLTNVRLRRCHNLRYLFTNDTSRTLDKLEKLDVSGCNSMLEVIATEESEQRKLKPVKFSHLRTLKLCSLKSLISFSSGSCAYEFPFLEKLSVLECTELKAFILRLPAPRVETMNEGSVGFDESPHPLFDEKVVFPKLEELRLTGIQSSKLWENEMTDESISQLKVLEVKQCPNLLNVIPSFMWKRLLHCMESLTVEECPRLRNLFTMSMAKSLVQLQHLILGGCREMEYIVAKEEETPVEAADIIVIPQLVTLYLHNMPKLRSFYQGKRISEWPSLKEFTVEDCKVVEVILGDANCRRPDSSIPTQQPLLLVEKVEFPSMESMKISHMDNVEKIWFGELASNAFTKLKTLVVEYCEKLPSIFSSHTILTRFQNLEKLTVTDCGYLEVVFHILELNLSEAHSTSTFQLRELVLTRLPSMKHVWSGLPQGGLTFGCLRSMDVEKCESLKSLFPSSVAKSMTQLEELLVVDCGVEEIIVEEDGVGMNASDLFFPQLIDLRLLELPKLRSFCRNSHTSTWPLLKQLRVRHCGKMRPFSFACEFQSCQGTTTSEDQPALFSFEKVIPRLEGLTLAREDVEMMPQHFVSGNIRDLTLACYHDENDAFPSNFLLHKFPNLEELLVRCSSFEEIFPEDASGHGGATHSGGLTDVQRPLKALRNLKRLNLYELCNLRRVWKGGSLMAEILKQIQTLWVGECPSLSIVFPSTASFQSLMHLGVEDCAGLVHLGTCSAMTSLVHLTWLNLRNCGAMENVVTDDGNRAEEISFPKLEVLILDGLPRLESFSPTYCAFRFPSLVRIVVTRCPKMNIFCKGALRTPNLDKLLLSDEDDEGRWEGDLNTTIQTLST